MEITADQHLEQWEGLVEEEEEQRITVHRVEGEGTQVGAAVPEINRPEGEAVRIALVKIAMV